MCLKKYLMYTNPLLIPIGIGIMTSIILKNLFGGVYKDTIKVVKKLDAE